MPGESAESIKVALENTSPAFLRYVDCDVLESDLVIQAHLEDSSGGDDELVHRYAYPNVVLHVTSRRKCRKYHLERESQGHLAKNLFHQQWYQCALQQTLLDLCLASYSNTCADHARTSCMHWVFDVHIGSAVVHSASVALGVADAQCGLQLRLVVSFGGFEAGGHNEPIVCQHLAQGEV